MKKIFIKDLKEYMNQKVMLQVFANSVTKNVRDNKKSFYGLTMGDRTGTVNGKIWQEFMKDEYESYNEMYVEVTGIVTEYQDKPFLKIEEMRLLTSEEVKMEDFVNAPRSLEKTTDELAKYMNMVKNPFLKAILKLILGDEIIRTTFLYSQAGTKVHHNYVGGLSSHTLKLVKMGVDYHESHDDRDVHSVPINLCLFITAALLHDIGKIREYYPFPINKRTKQGKLVGHINLGLDMISSALFKLMDIDSTIVDMNLYYELMHCITTSHGMSNGVEPSTLEAVMLHNLDKMDSHFCGAELSIFNERDSRKNDDFTEFSGFYKTQFLKREVTSDV